MEPDKLKKSTTTDGKVARPGFENAAAPAPTKENGQHEAYWILSDAERKKGFVRPIRHSYIHIGRAVCGKYEAYDGAPERPDLVAKICIGLPGHDGDCSFVSLVTQAQLRKIKGRQLLGGCDTHTSMAQAIAETYARDPSYYGSTFCCHCGTHKRVGKYGEFVWLDDPSERVGT